MVVGCFVAGMDSFRKDSRGGTIPGTAIFARCWDVKRREAATIYLRLVEGAASVLDGIDFCLIHQKGGVIWTNVHLTGS